MIRSTNERIIDRLTTCKNCKRNTNCEAQKRKWYCDYFEANSEIEKELQTAWQAIWKENDDRAEAEEILEAYAELGYTI